MEIFILEDNAEINRVLQSSLPGYTLNFSHSIREFEAKIASIENASLFLLDVELPDGDSYALCQKIRSNEKTKNVPVIFLTARTKTAEKVVGLSLGVDDYITKPFDPVELKARVDLRIQKSLARLQSLEIFKQGGLEFQIPFQKLFWTEQGQKQELELSAFDFKILLFLAKNEGRIFTREQLIDTFWGTNVNVLDRTIDTHMSHIRNVLSATGYSVSAVYGSGYRFGPRKKEKKKAA